MNTALRDWRIWALLATVQWPGIHTIAKYAPWPTFTAALVFGAATVLYDGLLNGRVRGLPRGRWPLLLAAGAVLAASLTLYPRADALKISGAGSDQDDALITTARRLVTLQRPVYVPTYLGNPPSPGPGWALLAAPLVLAGGFPLLTPIAFATLLWIVSRRASAPGALLAAVLPLSSPGFWELLANGSDLFAIGVLFTGLAVVGYTWRSRALDVVGGCILASAAASSRVVFACVPAGVALFMWRSGRRGVLAVALATVGTIAAELSMWNGDAGATPLHLVTATTPLMGAGWVLAVACVFLASAAIAVGQARDDLAAWWRGVWLLVAAPLAVVSIGALVAFHLSGAEWYAASYLEVAVAPLVASIAISFSSTGQPASSAYSAELG